MKILLTILTSILAQTVFGQFAIITDKDGFVNVRSSANAGNKVVDKLLNGDIVFCLEPENEWLPVDYNLGRESKTGFIHETRVKFLRNFKKVPRQILTDYSVVFKRDSLTITLTSIPFIANKNKLQYNKGYPSKNEIRFLEKINGKEIWGTDGNIPKRQYGKIIVQLGEDLIYLPVENLFEPNLDNTSATIGNNGTIYLSANNSDGAGGYAVLWIIEKGKFTRRITTIPF